MKFNKQSQNDIPMTNEWSKKKHGGSGGFRKGLMGLIFGLAPQFLS